MKNITIMNIYLTLCSVLLLFLLLVLVLVLVLLFLSGRATQEPLRHLLGTFLAYLTTCSVIFRLLMNGSDCSQPTTVGEGHLAPADFQLF